MSINRKLGHVVNGYLLPDPTNIEHAPREILKLDENAASGRTAIVRKTVKHDYTLTFSRIPFDEAMAIINATDNVTFPARLLNVRSATGYYEGTYRRKDMQESVHTLPGGGTTNAKVTLTLQLEEV